MPNTINNTCTNCGKHHTSSLLHSTASSLSTSSSINGSTIHNNSNTTVPLASNSTSTNFHTRGAKPGARWQKVLYVRQPYADNHVDETFLASLVTNANVQPVEFWSMVKATAGLIQQISIMTIYFLLYGFVHRNMISVNLITVCDILLTTSLIVAQRLAGPQFYTAGLLPDTSVLLRYFAIFLSVLFSFSPILQTLTQSYCNDTIWALTILLSTIHIVTHPYHVTNHGTGIFLSSDLHSLSNSGSNYDPSIVSSSSSSNLSNNNTVPGTLSLNAAMFAAVLLASRLSSITHVFIFIVLAIQLFALFPIMRDYIRVRSEYTHIWVTIILSIFTVILLFLTSTLLAIVYIGGVLFISFICPLWLMSAQKYKNEIQGPWDIATVAQFST